MSITIDLRDYEPVDQHIVNGSETMRRLCELFDTKEEDCIDLFCREIQKRLEKSNAKDVYLLNNSKKIPRLFSELDREQWTQGYVGVLQFAIPPKKGGEPEQITINIRSRFDDSKESRFLMYVFERTFGARGKIFDDMKISGYQTDTWDLLLTATFVRQLHDAMKKGFFRQYREYEYNDDHVRGRIDIARHIRENPLFTGKVAYTCREYTVDNPLNALVLRAFDYLDREHHVLLRNLIARDDVVKQGIQFLQSEVKGWQQENDYAAIRKAKQKIAQSVYRNYEPLRKTAIAVLKRMGVNAFVRSDSTITGMLIDMPKLWEEFLYNTVIREYSGKTGQYKQNRYPIIDGARLAEPDFLLQEQRIVLDAKYKASWGKTLEGSWTRLRDDVYQIISYALIFDCKYCGVVFPVHEENIKNQKLEPVVIGQKCQDRYFVRIPYVVPKDTADDESYRKTFSESDRAVVQILQGLATSGGDLSD